MGQMETDSSGRCSFGVDPEMINRCGIYKAKFTVLGDGSQVTIVCRKILFLHDLLQDLKTLNKVRATVN